MARRFMMVCAGLLMLTVAYVVGSRNAVAQSAGGTVVDLESNGSLLYAVTANGDVYVTNGQIGQTWQQSGNIFTGPTPARSETWGQLKNRFREPARVEGR